MAYEIIALSARTKNIEGRVFGRLLCILPVERKSKQIAWLCICDCGTETIVTTHSLTNGRTKSCGCLRTDVGAMVGKKSKHGMSQSSEYGSWTAMKKRCLDKNHQTYKHHGGRGITICKPWKDSFENFYSDMGKKPSSRHSLDRIDNDGDYTPQNCRWATPKQQGNNRRDNTLITFKDETMTLSEWAIKTGIKPTTISARINHSGWDVETALTTPVRGRTKRA